jgi:flavin reductase (DIM6/NTAB) family NADH-FMN oxidoreductase RutF
MDSINIMNIHVTTRQSDGYVLGLTPSGLFVLTAADAAGHETGMLASWVTSGE